LEYFSDISNTAIADTAAAQSFGNLDLSSLLGTAATPAAQRGGLTSEDLQRAMIGATYLLLTHA
jgi:hypothetical protein